MRARQTIQNLNRTLANTNDGLRALEGRATSEAADNKSLVEEYASPQCLELSTRSTHRLLHTLLARDRYQTQLRECQAKLRNVEREKAALQQVRGCQPVGRRRPAV